MSSLIGLLPSFYISIFPLAPLYYFFTEPTEWSVAHVKHWLIWAVKQFSIPGVDINGFNLNGKQLVALSHDAFSNYVPIDKGDVLWTHLELLRKCKFVGKY